jgi:hypothetical protein
MLKSSVVWWPLRPPRLFRSLNTIRFIWNCVSLGSALSFRITLTPCSHVEVRYSWTCPIRSPLEIGPKPIPPIRAIRKRLQASLHSQRQQHDQQPRQVHTFTGFLRKLSRSARNDEPKPSLGDLQPPRSTSEPLEEHFIHWCVKSKQFKTTLNHIHHQE